MRDAQFGSHLPGKPHRHRCREWRPWSRRRATGFHGLGVRGFQLEIGGDSGAVSHHQQLILAGAACMDRLATPARRSVQMALALTGVGKERLVGLDDPPAGGQP